MNVREGGSAANEQQAPTANLAVAHAPAVEEEGAIVPAADQFAEQSPAASSPLQASTLMHR